MISRVAESCFWFHRYLERVENTARLLQVHASFLLDADVPTLNRWHPTVIVAGEEERFAALVGAEAGDDGETVQEYFVWEERTQASIVSSLRFARENARTVREILSLEAWTAINSFWLWLTGGPGRRLYGRDRSAFYDRVREACHLFIGVCHDTMLHDEPFDFMRLGMLLERAGQTARIADIKYHDLGPTTGAAETPAEAAQWMAILRSCSATEAFFKRSQSPPSGPAVIEFLILTPDFPRAVLYAVTRAWHFLQRIRSRVDVGRGESSARSLESLVRRLRGRSGERILQAGVHTELTHIIDRTAQVCHAIQGDYFVVGQAPPP